MIYDYLIAGAGVAGLYTAYNIYKHNPLATICILEAFAYTGGRLHTIDYDGIKVDGGGARYNTKQHRIVHLIKELKLTNKRAPITNDSKYISVNPRYNAIYIKDNINLELLFPSMDIFIKDIQKIIINNKISNDDLINTTLLELAYKYYANQYPYIKEYLISINPYYSELAILNALEGIYLFTHEFASTMQYYILDGGLQQITDTLYKYLTNISTINILTEMPLESITHLINNDIYIIKSGNIIFNTKKIILALPKTALIKIKYITSNKDVYKMLNSIKNEPLYRIYARYPNNNNGKAWFNNMPKIVTNLPIKYIIPINDKKGIIMISYTDAKYAKYWFNKLSSGTFENTLNNQLKLLFPYKNIPKPKWYKHSMWTMGAGYWKKGIDKQNILHKIIKPLINDEIYICGENYSSHQAWVEGALETADMVLHKLGIIKQYNITKITTNKIIRTNKMHSKTTINKNIIKTYTIDEVTKHNTLNDAWIVIDGIVANITKWIPLHPGGKIIMKGVGSDASKLFHSINHDAYAIQKLKKYQIGILQQ